MSQWNEAEIARALGAVPIHSRPEIQLEGVSIDSRSLQSGNLFVCVRGQRTDGHQYIKQALAAGAGGLVLEEEALAAGGLPLPPPGSLPVFAVPDGVGALQDLARLHRQRQSNLKVFAITGSNGKTSTREMLADTLARLESPEIVHATSGNLNNHIGLPLTILSMHAVHRFAVLEMGMNHAGEIECLSRIACPDFGVVTSISGAHLEFFNSVEEIAAAKLEIISGMSAGSVLAFPENAIGQKKAGELCNRQSIELLLFADAKQLQREHDLHVDPQGINFHIAGQSIHNPHYFSPEMAGNLMACYTILIAAGYDVARVREALQKAQPTTGGRFAVRRIARAKQSEMLVVDDTYNANPDSFRAALEALRGILPHGRLGLLAGEMAELGASAAQGHAGIGKIAADLGFEILALVGSKSAEILKKAYESAGGVASGPIFNKIESGLEFAKSLQWSTFDGVLCKGSRSARMEEFLKIPALQGNE